MSGKEMSDRVSRVMVEASDWLRKLTGGRKWIGAFLGYYSFPHESLSLALREAFREAGAHVWSETDDTFAAGRGFLMIHSASDGEKKILLPERYDVTEVFGSEPPRKGVTAFTGYLKKGETRVYRIEE